MTTPGAPRPSDGEPRIIAAGRGEVAMAVLSMSGRHEEGRDAAYLEWHLLDHLPEQYRLASIRNGQRWVSTPACRATRAASEPPFDEVDHIVQYLFAEPLDEALESFFGLGATLHHAGRMPIGLPRRHLAAYSVAGRWGRERALVGGDVVPWRPSTGAYLVIERSNGTSGPTALDRVATAADLDGVVGGWQLRGLDDRHAAFDRAGDLDVAVLYLDGDPPSVGSDIARVLAGSWVDGDVEPLLAAAFHLAVPWRWDRALPDRDPVDVP